jgi:hydroxyacylglutathione hydrolase
VSESLSVLVFAGGPFAENGYLVTCRETASTLVVDPGATAPSMARSIGDEGLEVQAVVLTHAHLDHVEGIPDIRSVTDAPILLHPDDRQLYDAVQAQAAAFGLRVRPLPEPDGELLHGQLLRFGSCSFEVRHAPGHSPGHVILVSQDEGLALVADVVFQGSIGRTDLPGGDFRTLIDSIRREVLSLPDDTRLLTGHGGETRVGIERRTNPFLIPHYRGDMA